jgi:ribosomal protein S18 acetylase RimI-like enzyme
VHLASDAELPEVAKTLAAAFFDDPVARFAIQDDERRIPLMRSFFEIGLEKMWRQHNLIWTVEGVRAASIWVPPGRTELTEEEATDLMEALAAVLGDHMTATETIMSAMDELHPRAPHYYFAFIGTQPGWQGHGLGSALLRPMMERIDAEGMPAYTEATSERNRALYERHGFEFLGPLVVPGGPTMHRMWRTPRSR